MKKFSQDLEDKVVDLIRDLTGKILDEVESELLWVERTTRLETLEFLEDSIRKGRLGDNNSDLQEKIGRLLRESKRRGGTDCLEEVILLL